jgi:hypothetical protein
MRRFARHPVIGIVEALADETSEVPVDDLIHDPPAVAGGLDHSREAQFREVLTDRGARRPGGLRQRRHVGRTARQKPQQVKPRGIGQHSEDVTGRLQPGAIRIDPVIETRRWRRNGLGHVHLPRPTATATTLQSCPV